MAFIHSMFDIKHQRLWCRDGVLNVSADHILNVATSHKAGLCDGGQPANTNQMTGPCCEVSSWFGLAFKVRVVCCKQLAVWRDDCGPRIESLGAQRATAHFIVETLSCLHKGGRDDWKGHSWWLFNISSRLQWVSICNLLRSNILSCVVLRNCLKSISTN